MAKRHRWVWDTEETSGITCVSNRDKSCSDCGLRARRFGIGRDSYWEWIYPDGRSVYSTDEPNTPPCEPKAAEHEWDPARGPQYSHCIHCKRLIRRTTPEGDWINPGTLGTIYVNCDKAPNPDDGPMPGHEPGTIVSPPQEEPIERVDPATLPKPVIPWIPKMEA